MRTTILLAGVLTVALSTATLAQTPRYGDWVVDLNNSAVGAYTVNESGSMLGFICVIAFNKCLFYVSPKARCDPGSSSTILINSDAGALTSTVNCMKMGGTYYNAIQNMTDLEAAIQKSTTIGIAIPMASGYFKVVRFSLNGENAAVSAVVNRAIELEKSSDHLQ